MSNFKGVWIPKAIYENHSLTPTDKLILADIATMGEYFKSDEKIAEEIGARDHSKFKRLILAKVNTERPRNSTMNLVQDLIKGLLS